MLFTKFCMMEDFTSVYLITYENLEVVFELCLEILSNLMDWAVVVVPAQRHATKSGALPNLNSISWHSRWE